MVDSSLENTNNGNEGKESHSHQEKLTGKSKSEIVQINKRETLDPNNPNNVVSIATEIVASNEIHTGHTRIRAYETVVSIRDGDETKTITVHPHIIAYPANQDVVDILPFYTTTDESGNEIIKVIINKSCRPTVAARKHLVPGRFDEETLESGLVYESLGINVTPDMGDISAASAASRALKEKTGFHKKHGSTALPKSPYFSAVGGLGEMCIPHIIEIDAPEKIETRVSYGEDFSAHREVVSMSLQEVVDGYFSGDIKGLRLLHLACELAREKNIELALPSIGLKKTLTHYEGIEEKIVTHKNIEQKVTDILKNEKKIVSFSIKENNELYKDAQYQTKKTIKAKNILASGQEKEYSITPEMVVRENVDTVEVVAHFWHDDKLMIPVRVMFRPGIQTRNQEAHPIHVDSRIWNIEGISGKVKGTEQSKEDIIRTAKTSMMHRTGFTADVIEYIGSAFPSIGVTPEKKHTLYAQIDPTQVNKEKTHLEFDYFHPTVLFMDADEILRAADEGQIKDPSLVLHTNLLKQHYCYENTIDIEKRLGTDQEYAELQEIMEGPGQTDEFMKKVSEAYNKPEIYETHVALMKNSPQYRKQVCFNEQEQGATLFTHEMGSSPTDDQYFDPSIPNFRIPPKEVADKYAAYSGHDGAHYVYGGPAAWNKETGEFISKEDFVKINTWYESRAVCISDYLLPIDMGLDEFEKIIGGYKCLGRSLIELGIESYEEAHEIVTSIERDGIIPDKILLHEHYEKNRGNIVGRVLGFKPNDTFQSEAEYDYYVANPEIAKAKAEFAFVVATMNDAEKRINAFDDVLDNYPEGVNKLKGTIASHLTTHITNPAMRLAVLLQNIKDNKAPGYEKEVLKIEALLDQLRYWKKYIEDTRDMVKSMVLNDDNIIALRRMKHFKAQTQNIIDTTRNIIGETTTINKNQRDTLTDNYRPYFQGFVKMDPEENKKQINQLEQENLKRVGKTLPLYFSKAA